MMQSFRKGAANRAVRAVVMAAFWAILTVSAARAADAPQWSGEWRTFWRDGYALMQLEQDGSDVIGTFRPGGGRLEGRIEAGVLRGAWRQTGGSGRFVFALSADGQSFTGRFESGEYWNGERIEPGGGYGPDAEANTTPAETLRTAVIAMNRTRYDHDASAVLVWEPLLTYEGGAIDERERRRRRQLLARIVDMATFRLHEAPAARPEDAEVIFEIGPTGTDVHYSLRFRRDGSQGWRIVVGSEAALAAAERQVLDALGHDSHAEYLAARQQTPRATMRRFLQGYAAGTEEGKEAALSMLDLSYLPAHLRDVEGPMLADYLHQIINRAGFVVWQELPNDPAAAAPYEHYRHARGSVVIAPVQDDASPDGRAWRFSSDTLRAAPDLFGAMQALPPVGGITPTAPISDFFVLRDRMRGLSPQLVRRWLALELWQWAALGASVLAALGAGWAIGRAVPKIVAPPLRAVRGVDADTAARGLVWPLRTLVFGALLFVLFARFGIGETRIALLTRLVGLLAVVGTGWLVHRIVAAIGGHLVARAALRPQRLDEIVTALGVGLAKALVILVTVVAGADAVGLPYEGVLTGLGVGGLALAFAARETVSNMLAAAILLVDRPFRRGDLIEVGGAMATLEAVGLRSTRLRTFDDSVMIVPNSQLSDQSIVNWGERRRRKVTLAIGLTYDTPRERLDAFVADLRDVFAAQPCAAGGICHIGLSGFGNSSININLWGYFAVEDYEAQVRAQHRLIGDVVDLARRLDVSFAFPTRTIQIEQVSPGSQTA